MSPIQSGSRACGVLLALSGLAITLLSDPALGASLDEHDDIRLGLRIYSGARIGTETTDSKNTATILAETFPSSDSGHPRQIRSFAEVSLDHNLDRLVEKGFGPLSLLHQLPFRLRHLSYTLVFRGEYEGVYDFGTKEYRTAEAWKEFREPLLGRPLAPEVIGSQRRRLRRHASHRERLFQAFFQAEAGDLFFRFGRQILAWGETDAFRLLDNINPIDPSFGGFLIPLDERRVPLDMLRANYNIGSVGPFSQMYIEGFVAVDNEVSFIPGVPIGSPWAPPNALPTTLISVVADAPPANFENARFGAQLKFNYYAPVLGEVTLGLAHYYTYLDLPAVNNQVLRGPIPGFPGVWPDDDPDGAGYPPGDAGALVKARFSAPRARITGVSSTFVIPSRFARRLRLAGEPVIRTELAYFGNEPRYKQSDLDPISIASQPDCVAAPEGSVCQGGRRTKDSWNFVIGIDLNQYIRFLNPSQSFFISTQFFYKHLLSAAKRRRIPGVTELTGISDGEVLPVPEFIYKPSFRIGFVHNPIDQYLQTLLVATSYYGGRINPAFLLIYDWSGSLAIQPQATFVRDPFRLSLGYSYLEASRLKGASGVSLLRDRDNFFFQVEYVL